MKQETVFEIETLPEELRSVVRISLSMLGEAIALVQGEEVFQKTEMFRARLKGLRGKGGEAKKKELLDLYDDFDQLKPNQKKQITHSFALMMEMINRCEKAYRTFRLRQKRIDGPREVKSEIVYVFTAHPTEARSKNAIELLNQFESCCLEIIESGGELSHSQLLQLRQIVALLLRSQLSKKKSPTVKDEAIWLYDIILAEQILDGQIEQLHSGVQVRFRSWVGGDKDGHPYVDAKSTQMSWSESRKRLCAFISIQLNRSEKMLELADQEKFHRLQDDLRSLAKKLSGIAKVTDGDGRSVEKFQVQVEKVAERFKDTVGEKSLQLQKVIALFELYPALVVPLEFREDAEIVTESLGDSSFAIRQMFKALKAVSKGSSPKNYVQGFVLSMVQSSADVRAGIQLMKKDLGKNWIPVIPLFETRQALLSSSDILEDLLNTEGEYYQYAKLHWQKKLEVMLGYSDSSKENGVLLSRVLIAKTLADLSELIVKQEMVPVFFHGSGGSVERGGGSISDQISGWPPESLPTYKSTVQGEMISRNFGNAIIMERLIEKWLVESKSHIEQWKPSDFEPLMEMAETVSVQYRELVAADWFRELVLKATPYQFLDQLKIGSRPSKRNKNQNEFKMRAIPWVLCWTQTRSLLPVWWGLGHFWSGLSEGEKDKVLSFVESSPLIRSYFRVVGFTLAKVDLEVFEIYLVQNLPQDEASSAFEKIESEFLGAKDMYEYLSAKSDQVGLADWLSASITLRSPNIDLLNFAQILAVKNGDMELLREATTGIACGMLTTG